MLVLKCKNYACSLDNLTCYVGWSEDLVVEAFEANRQEALDKAGISVADMSKCTTSTKTYSIGSGALGIVLEHFL